MSDEKENGPSPSAVAGADAIRQYIEAKTAKDERLVDLLHKALGARYGVKPDDEED